MDWQPIETAPKDRRILLYRPTAIEWARIVIGRYDDDRFEFFNPRPHWMHDLCQYLGEEEAHNNAPTHWADTPEPPK